MRAVSSIPPNLVYCLMYSICNEERARRDLNPQPSGPKPDALSKLRHVPIGYCISAFKYKEDGRGSKRLIMFNVP